MYDIGLYRPLWRKRLRLLATITSFWRSQQANTATVLALVAPVVMGASALAIDAVDWMKDKSNLQEVADTAAVAAAREMGIGVIGAYSELRAKSVAEAIVSAQRTASGASVRVDLNSAQRSVVVTLERGGSRYLSGVLGVERPLIRVAATAANVGEQICVIALGLDPTRIGLQLRNTARLTAAGCSVYSNSTANNSIQLDNNSFLIAQNICTSGGWRAGNGSRRFNRRPLTSCPPAQDPLAQRSTPPSNACPAKVTRLVIKGNRTLQPGTYCGGVRITDNAQVRLDPGIYVFKDGPLIVEQTASLRGVHVSLIFVGGGAIANFKQDTTIDIGAPASGSMAGILMFEDREVPLHQRHNIRSNNAYNLTGTIYLPRGNLSIDSDNVVAERSPWTAIIASRITVENNANVVLNDRYSETDVPVPLGVGTPLPQLLR